MENILGKKNGRQLNWARISRVAHSMMQPDWLYFQNWVTVLSFSDLQNFLRWLSVNLVSTSSDVPDEVPFTPTKLFIALLE